MTVANCKRCKRNRLIENKKKCLCKSCTVSINRMKKREYYNNYQNQYRAKNPKIREYYRKKGLEWHYKNREKHNAHMRKYAKKMREKNKNDENK